MHSGFSVLPILWVSFVARTRGVPARVSPCRERAGTCRRLLRRQRSHGPRQEKPLRKSRGNGRPSLRIWSGTLQPRPMSLGPGRPSVPSPPRSRPQPTPRPSESQDQTLRPAMDHEKNAPSTVFPLWPSRLRTRLVPRRRQTRSLALLSGLRVWHCRELQCRSQTQLRSGDAAAMVEAGSYSSDSTPSLGMSICHDCIPKKQKNKKQKQKQKSQKKKVQNLKAETHVSFTDF